MQGNRPPGNSRCPCGPWEAPHAAPVAGSTAGFDHIPYGHLTHQGLRVDFGSVPSNRQPLASVIDRWLRDGSFDEGGDTETEQELNIANTETTLSFVPSLPFLLTLNTSGYSYAHGAAHPLFSSSSRHFNVAAGRPMTSEDVFARPGWEPSLTTYVERVLRKELGEVYSIESSTELQALVIDPTRWSFNGKALTVNFSNYEVAPYVAGPQTVTVPWAVVAPWLSESVRRSVNAPR